MIESSEHKRSRYMEWAKTRSHASFNLATSGVTSVPFAELGVTLDQLEITGADGYGYSELQHRLAHHAGAPEECIIAATGTSMANHLAMAAVLDPGDEVLVELPVYGPVVDVAHYLGARIRRFTRSFETGFAVDPTELRKAITPQTRLIVLTNLHNPSGALIDADTLREVGKLARDANAHVLVDEVYLELLFDKNAPFAFHIGEELASAVGNPFIITNSLTKAYGLSGLRCGWIVAAPKLASRMWRLNDLFGVNAAHPAEKLAVTAFDQLEKFRARARSLLTTNRVLLDRFLDSRNDLDCFRAPAGTVAFPKVMRGSAETLVTLLRDKYETSVVPGEFFDMPQHFRIGIGCETETLAKGLQRLGTALDELAGT